MSPHHSGAAAAAKSLQSCLTLCDPRNDSPPGSPVPGILQARNVRLETIKLLEENIGRTLDYINQNKTFYDPTPRVMEMKTEINKWDLIKLN